MLTRFATELASISDGGGDVGSPTDVERVVLRDGLARVDHFDREAIAAIAPDGATVGVARYLRIGKSRSAEVAVAVTVADAWRGRGIASMLLERVSAMRSVGIEQFIAICLARNHRVIRLLSRLGPTTIGPSDAGVVELRIDLTSTRPDCFRAGPPSGERPD